ncbi:MAG: hypothetical protein CSB24_05890 [Deltaproteobacteria bacterium]|nr:MAG: hypothetical protein CSB24_05890 [Deltaproteobacteria bacterium]
MEQLTSADTVHQGTTVPKTEPLYQYVPANQLVQTNPQVSQYVQQVPSQYQQTTYDTKLISSETLAAGVFGVVVASTRVLGANLHKVQDGDMGMGEAVTDSLVKGAAGGLAAATATAAASTLTSGGFAGLAVTLATATGVSYLLSGQ